MHPADGRGPRVGILSQPADGMGSCAAYPGSADDTPTRRAVGDGQTSANAKWNESLQPGSGAQWSRCEREVSSEPGGGLCQPPLCRAGIENSSGADTVACSCNLYRDEEGMLGLRIDRAHDISAAKKYSRRSCSAGGLCEVCGGLRVGEAEGPRAEENLEAGHSLHHADAAWENSENNLDTAIHQSGRLADLDIPIHRAAGDGRVEAVRCLLQAGGREALNSTNQVSLPAFRKCLRESARRPYSRETAIFPDLSTLVAYEPRPSLPVTH